jgi:bacillopeptidase F
MRLVRTYLTLCLLAACPGMALAGELAVELQQEIKDLGPNEKVSVWIRPANAAKGREIAASAAQAATRGERYRLTIEQLKSNVESGQVGILENLRALERSGRAAQIKGHWVSNIIEARVTKAELASLAERTDIAMIYAVPTIELIAPRADATAVASPDTTYTNIKYIKAPQAWAQGYTGAGRVICIFDTGVDGAHRALKSRWKGINADSAACWFDPVTHTKYPQVVAGGFPQHGTHVAGIALGRDSVTNDTIGVAPGAKWIAAAVIDRAGASLLDAFDWAANPDGDPNTVEDLPDVINHSWGYSKMGCADLFFDAIDNTEALGIVNIFAAGNEGSGDLTIRVPAVRDNDSIDCFAVGASDIYTTPSIPTVWVSSSRGPSSCNGHMKPNVVAPGFNIRSSYPNNTYTILHGTSMAAPHVSGLVALLRQKNPNATVAEIKTAILNSTKRTNAGIIPNKAWGWGEIDCQAALAALPANPSAPKLRIWDFPHPVISAGETFNAPVILQNRGTVAASGVTGMINSSDSRLTIVNGAVSFGTVDPSDTTWSTSNIQVSVAAGVPSGTLIPLSFLISPNGGSTVPATLYFQVGTPSTQGFATHANSKFKFSLTNYGLLGGGPNSMFNIGGAGFQLLPSTVNDLYEGGLMIGTGLSKVSSAVHSYIDKPDQDFKVTPGGDIVYSAPGTLAAQETHAVFADNGSGSPIGVEITQDSYVLASPNDDFVTIRYALRNTTGSTISNLRVGLYFDWDCGANYRSNAGGFDSPDSVLWIAYDNGSTQSAFRGCKVVQGPLVSAMTGKYDDIAEIPFFGGNGFATYEKYQTLTYGFDPTDSLKSRQDQLFQVLTAGPLTLLPGGVDTVAFAVMGAADLAGIRAIADRATLSIPWKCCHGTAGNVDCDTQGNIDIADLTRFVDYLFISFSPLCCIDAAQMDNETPIDIADLSILIDRLFISLAPYPPCP